MIKISKVIVCEGKYDKIKLSSIFDATIISVDGFSIFKNKKQLDMLKKMAEKCGIIIATDSDSAGFKIRNHIKKCVGINLVTNVYLPDVIGKEKRKAKASKEGKLGVEGLEKNLILNAFVKAGIIDENFSEIQSEDQTFATEPKRLITKADFFEFGLSGKDNSTQKRNLIKQKLNLPERISQNGLIDALNITIDFDEFLKLLKEIDEI